jgi:rod shape-determining protein MreD
MRWILYSLVLLAAALLDGGNLLNTIALGSGHVRPVMLTIVLVFSCLNSRRKDAVGCAFVVGFAADLASAAMGPHMIIYGIVGVALNSMSHMVSMKRIIHQCLVIFLVSLLAQFPAAWLEAWKTGQDMSGLVSITLGTALYTTVFAPVVWLVLHGIWKRIYPHAEGRSRLR